MSNQTFNSKKGRPKNLSDGFLEAFRDLGSGMIKDTKQSVLGNNASLLPNEYPQSADLFNQENNLEKQYRQRWLQSEQIRRNEQVLFTRQQKETQQQVVQLQTEIKGLAKATGELAREVNISAMQVSADTPASAYHLNFFEHLRQLVRKLKTQIQESSVWLAEFNKKSKKKNAYWGGVKKQGSKFLLSQDRYMATQAG